MKNNFVKIPHLPKGKVGELIIGERYREKLDTPLKALGIEPLWLPPVPGVDERLYGHADLGAVHLGGNILIVTRKLAEESTVFVNKLTSRGVKLIFSENTLGMTYPDDAGMNVCIIGNTLVHKLAITDRAVCDNFSGHLLNVSQGYTKCSVCVISDSAAITSDSGVSAALQEAGFDVLKISPGCIALDGFNTGFIGGAAFFVSQNELAFTGKLDGHPDHIKILEFLTQHGICPVFLTDKPVFDIGSAIPLTERGITD